MEDAMSEPTPGEQPDDASSGGPPIGKIVGGLLALVVVVVLARWAGGQIDVFREWVAGLGAIGPIVFILGYAIGVVAFLPGSALTLAGGAVFGVGEGTLYVFVAASLGACAAFLVARYAAREAIERRVAGNAKFAAIDHAIGEQGLKITFLLRLSPVIPFVLLNYALGLTRVRFGHYALACFGMIPGTLLYVYAGSLAADAASAAGGGEAADTGRLVLNVVAAVATLLVTVVITRIARRALREAGADAPASQEA